MNVFWWFYYRYL